MGSADTARDPRGFAIKFYTEEGNWDLVGLNSPIFFIRDPIFFPNFIHSQKRNPQTNLKDPNMMWDFWSLRPEGTHAIMFLFSDRGTPDGVRHINGYGCHTFKMVNNEGEAFFCKFHFKPEQGIKNLSSEEAVRLQGTDSDYATRDLYNSIENGDFPAWNMMIQVMPFEEANKTDFNPFDVTKVWPHKDFPLIPVGRLVLDRNPKNYFAEVEQSAFSPTHVVPGIELSPDRMLQGRLFSYPDAQFHRLGPNHSQLPINCPYRSKAHNTQRGGWCTFASQDDAPNYFPNSFGGPVERADVAEHKHTLQGEVWRHDSKDDDNFSQAADFWNKVLDHPARERLVKNIADSLKQVKPFIQDRVIGNFGKVSNEMAEMLREKIETA